jgi:hypothetical protein
MIPEPQFHEEFSFCVNEREIGYATIQVGFFQKKNFVFILDNYHFYTTPPRGAARPSLISSTSFYY